MSNNRFHFAVGHANLFLLTVLCILQMAVVMSEHFMRLELVKLQTLIIEYLGKM